MGKRYIDADEFVKRVIQYPRQSTKTIGLALADTPTADVVERRRGEWFPILEVNENGEPYQVGVYCSECGDDESYEPYFCPNCGADMRGGTDG